MFCTPLSVEGLLLEYARLKDEGAAAPAWSKVPEHLVLCVLDTPPEGGAVN